LVGGMQPRRILLAGLTEADTRRLQVYLLVESDRLCHEWRFVIEGPVDVYLYDGDEPPTVPGSLEQAPHQVRIVDDARRAEPGDLSVMRRPLQYEDFMDILAAVEQRKPPAAPPSLPAAAPSVRASAPAVTPQQALRFRLQRWPGISLLDAFPHGLRMASFITVRYLSVDELSSLSGVSLDGCRRFLNTMMDNGLLRAEPVERLGWSSAPVTPRVASTPASARPDRSLLTSLRAKLGILLERP
jgi:hypothetical protein